MAKTDTIGPVAQKDQGAKGASSMDTLSINTIRTLAMDAVEKAKSGHPGTPMGLAPAAYTLWSRFLRYDPDRPDWPNRDRFVLSCGHASLLLYSLLHLAGVREIDADGKPTGKPAVSLDDIKAFRQLDSRTPGHPEYRLTTGVETTTGPLGQGCGNSVGMAMAGRWLATRFNKPGATLFDYNVYVFCSDGDMMEGVASEAASLAGHQKLSNLCWIYDSNSVTIEGNTPLAFSEDVGKRFEGYGWTVIHVDDGNDTEAFAKAIEAFQANTNSPTLIVLKSIIGYGSSIAGTAKAHSDAMGAEVIAATKKVYGWPETAQFLVPDGVIDHLHGVMSDRAHPLSQAWDKTLAKYSDDFPAQARELDRLRGGHLPDGWDKDLPVFETDAKGIASREASGKVLNLIAARVQGLLGGAADLAPSTKTKLTGEDETNLEAQTPGGRNMHFGVREHAMGAIANGMALCYLRPYTATFLVFSDYMRPPIRLAAIMELPVVFVFSHDSIGVGEDGPTHQPIEHLAALRAIPSLNVIRPGDANETAEAWRMALSQSNRPSALILSRQALPTLDRTKYTSASGLQRGAYVLTKDDGRPELILLATGSEVPLAVAAHEKLTGEGIRSRVVSMPSWSVFEQQDAAYRESVLPKAVRARVAVEQAAELGWDRYVGMDGKTVTMSTFGASAPISKLQAKFGFTVDHVCGVARKVLAGVKGTNMTNPLKALTDAGQSVWLDFLDRSFLKGGGFQKLIDEDSLSGVTSNPTIFEKAMGHGDAYDAEFQAYLKTSPGAKAIDIYEHLAVQDIQTAADLLRPVYERLQGRDGYVSLEVSPYLANDTLGTTLEARRLWTWVNRPNLMIKVPGTEAGVPAIRTLIEDGLNINVTLLFSIDAYKAVAEAYVAGLEARVAKGQDISRISSVASFFVSRIDTVMDKKIEAMGAEDAKAQEAKGLSGKIAVANAKVAYAWYEDLIASGRWKALAALGAQPQRLLWASTGTKNPAYSDVLYIDGLIGPDTVNTMPQKTMDAFRDHGVVAATLTQDVAGAKAILAKAEALGLDLDGVTRDLVADGVKLFSQSFDALLGAVDDRHKAKEASS
jgi:transketolase